MFYTTIILAANVLVFRMTHVGSLTISAGAYLIPFWFILADIIAEVYGYEICKRVIWFCLICNFVFGLLCTLSIYLPSPKDWQHALDYKYVLEKQIQVSSILIVAVIIGGFMNAYLISKWKVMLRGKYFWLRCLGASCIGQLIFSLVTIILNFHDTLSTQQLLHYIIFAYPEKMLETTILSIPAVYIVWQLKKIEKIDMYDQTIKLNPFAL